ncbi:MAG: hypothetical protein L6U99_01660 [Clostridium sp.]|nr:MAG: hypothetical protein L6U99_01660 [Clostridium sp.]
MKKILDVLKEEDVCATFFFWKAIL